MACFSGTLTSDMHMVGYISPFLPAKGDLTVVCPVNIGGPHSLLYDDGTEVWADYAYPIDFE